MKFLKTIILSLALIMGFAQSANAANKKEPVWMFGLAASFSDSTVYMTDIQIVDSAYTNNHGLFLSERNEYSNQLRAYLKAQGVKAPTCVTTFARKYKEIEKKYLKMKRRYTLKGQYNVKYTKGFIYEAVRPMKNY